MKTPPADLARRLMAAGDTILNSGADVRLEEVAAEVGVARTTLYYYFSGREDLLAFLLAEHLKAGAQIIAAATAGDDPPATKLHRLTSALLQFLGQHPGLCTGLLASLGAAGRMDDVLAANQIHVATPVRDLVSAGIGAGDVPAGNPDDIANALLGAILFVVLSRTGQRLDLADSDQLADRILRGALG